MNAETYMDVDGLVKRFDGEPLTQEVGTYNGWDYL